MPLLPCTQVLLCNQYHSAKACRCCHAHNTKHTDVAMQPILLSHNMLLLPCTQMLLCNQYHSAKVAVHTIPKTQPLPCSQYHSAKACSCCHAHNTRHELLLCNQYHFEHTAIACTQKPSMQLLLCNQYHLAKNMQLLPCTHQTRSYCHATNITQLKHAAVAMHMISDMNCCYATNIKQTQTIAMQPISNVQLLQAHKNQACSFML